MMLELLTFGVSDRTEWRVVRLTLPDGRCGLGEASDSGTLPAAIEALETLVPHLRDLPVTPPTAPVDVQSWSDAGLDLLPDDHRARAVLGGLEQAACDLAAGAAERPVWQWLTGNSTAPPAIPCYANINRAPGGRTPDDVARAAVAAVTAGFDTVKCAPFDRPDDRLPLAAIGLERIRAVREAVGDDITLLVDCHLRLPLDELVSLLPALHEVNLGWLEDAAAVSDLAGLRRLRHGTDIPLAGGEFSFDADQVLPAVGEGLLDALLVDVKHAGGITRAHALAQRARAAGDVAITPHNPTGPVGTAASAHLFLSTPCASLLEVMVGETGWRPDSVRPPERLGAGRLIPPDGPGLGVALDNAVGSPRVAWSTVPSG